jgi:hypothetical protein
MHKRSRMTRILRISENLETEGNEDSEVPARSVQIEIIFVSFVIFCGKKKRFGTGRYLGFTQATSVAPGDPLNPCYPREPRLIPLAHSRLLYPNAEGGRARRSTLAAASLRRRRPVSDCFGLP